MSHEVSEEEKKLARQPHDLFLINLIFNHILMFAAALGAASSYPLIILPIPLFSAGVLIYTLWRAKRSLEIDPWFAKCHWQMAARRSRMFLVMLGAVTGLVMLILLFAGGHPKPQHLAILGAVILPTMVTILVLVVLETDALQQARHGMMPKWVEEKFPRDASLAPDGAALAPEAA